MDKIFQTPTWADPANSRDSNWWVEIAVSYHRQKLFIHLNHLITCSAGLEMLPGYPAPVINTFGIAFWSSKHDPEVISPMIPSSGHPIGLLSTGKSCTSSPSPIGPMSFLPSIDHVGPLPEANELGKLHMGPVSSLASVSSMPKLTFLIPRVIGTPQIYFY